MPTSEEMKATKTAQVRESLDRNGRAPDAAAARELNQAALDVVDDSNVPVDEPSETPRARQTQEADEPAPVRREPSPSEARRLQIIKGFRDQRAADSEADAAETKDIRRLTRDGMPPELVPLEIDDTVQQDEDEQVPEVAAEDVEREQEAPVTRKIKVRGKEIEVTEEQLLEYAQKGAAGDDYLGEAKSKLDEVNELLRATKTKAPGTGTTGEHHASPTTQSDTDPSAQDVDGQHQTDPFVSMVESVQLGTPEEAAVSVRKTVQDTAKEAAREALNSERLRDEVARSARFLKDFQDKNGDIASDPLAHAVIERTLYDMQVDDIKALGIKDSDIPRTPTDIANWHLWYRANGYKVRNIPALLDAATDKYKEWKGVPKTTTEQPAPRKAEPRVEVTIDRSQRRAAIQPQPSRSATPAQPSRAQAPAQPRDRSDVVQQMIAARAKPRGKVGLG